MSFEFLLIFLIIVKIINSVPDCKPKTNFCENCNFITNLCNKCIKPDILVINENGGCDPIQKCSAGINYCLECEINEDLCKKCEENYYKDENGGCAYSEGCEISYRGECLKCKEGFVLIGKEKDFRLCKSLSIEDYKNCKEINYETGFCSICEDNFYLTSGDKKCVRIENCKESIFGNCISCNNNYYYNKIEDKCLEKKDNFMHCMSSIDGINCEKCDDDYYKDENGICIDSQYCLESENLKCKKCKPGYYLSFYNICTNTDNCYLVDKPTSICTFCNNKYYLDKKDYSCKSNQENNQYIYCEEAINDECIKCQTNYYLGDDSRCSDSEYCIESENGICKICQNGYHLGFDNICTNIDKCIYSRLGECIECENGYYYNKRNKTCLLMENQFLNCKYSCINGDTCCECKEDFYLYLNDSLCYDNTKEEKFSKCVLVDSLEERCIICTYGYFLSSEDYKCSKVDKCKIVGNENKCLECDKYYCLDVKKQECFDNDYYHDLNDKKYISCLRTNEEGTACEKCLEGYEVNEEGFCVDKDYCEEKKDGKCLKCKDIIDEDGYEFCANEIFGCIQSVIDNCLRCDNLEDLYECTECKEGYNKTFLGCIKNE